MRIHRLHSWKLSPREAIALQKTLRQKLVLRGHPKKIRYVAGVDAAFCKGQVYGVVVVWDLREKKIVEQQTAMAPIQFPYVPGLLTFREAPALLSACKKLKTTPDLVLVDGQGIAHPRRMGIAAHLGLWLNLPSIGVAKSRLVGKHRPLSRKRGSHALLIDRGEAVGLVYRSRDGGRPLFVSPGHRVGFEAMVPLLKPCFDGFRLPEPTRLADKLSKRYPT